LVTMTQLVLKEGFLVKKGALRKNWKRRWFELTETKLSYFKKKKKKREGEVKSWMGMIDIPLVQNVEQDQTDKTTFYIYTAKRIYPVRADSADEVQDWIMAIRKVSDPSKKVSDPNRIDIPSSPNETSPPHSETKIPNAGKEQAGSFKRASQPGSLKKLSEFQTASGITETKEQSNSLKRVSQPGSIKKVEIITTDNVEPTQKDQSKKPEGSPKIMEKTKIPDHHTNKTTDISEPQFLAMYKQMLSALQARDFETAKSLMSKDRADAFDSVLDEGKSAPMMLESMLAMFCYDLNSFRATFFNIKENEATVKWKTELIASKKYTLTLDGEARVEEYKTAKRIPAELKVTFERVNGVWKIGPQEAEYKEKDDDYDTD